MGGRRAGAYEEDYVEVLELGQKVKLSSEHDFLRKIKTHIRNVFDIYLRTKNE